MYFSFFRISRTRESFHLPPETVGTPLASSARAMPTVEPPETYWSKMLLTIAASTGFTVMTPLSGRSRKFRQN